MNNCFNVLQQLLNVAFLNFRIGSLIKEIKKSQRLVEQRQKRKLEKRVDCLKNAQKLGKTAYEKPEMEIQLSEEISGSLRRMKVNFKKCKN